MDGPESSAMEMTMFAMMNDEWLDHLEWKIRSDLIGELRLSRLRSGHLGHRMLK